MGKVVVDHLPFISFKGSRAITLQNNNCNILKCLVFIKHPGPENIKIKQVVALDCLDTLKVEKTAALTTEHLCHTSDIWCYSECQIL